MAHALGNVCRVCGRKLKAKKEKRVMTYACSSHQQGLERAFSINVEKDTPDVQPTSFCLACYMVMQRSDKAATKGTPYEHSVEVYEWIPHNTEECRVST